jgi:hypothetical protein
MVLMQRSSIASTPGLGAVWWAEVALIGASQQLGRRGRQTTQLATPDASRR